ncbi:MAG: adenylate/guanylate cyclase domain-containing protein [Treponema sp.]|nr:adenylate/guanylate cyclase domain-containing protein [Treponema sp.]
MKRSDIVKVDEQKTQIVKKVKFPLGVKLAIIIGLVVLISLGTVTFLNSYFSGRDVRRTAEESNLSVNSRCAKMAENEILRMRASVFQLLDLMNSTGNSSMAIARQAQIFFYERNGDVASINILGLGDIENRNVNIPNEQFFIENEIESSLMQTFFLQNSETVMRSCAGETVAANPSPIFGVPAITIFFPYKENGLDQACAITFSLEAMSEVLGIDTVNTTFLINDSSDLLFHPDTERVLRGETMESHPLVSMMKSQIQNGQETKQVQFEDEVQVEEGKPAKKQKFLGAYSRIETGDIGVYTSVPLDYVLEGVRDTMRLNIYTTLIVFFLSIIVILLFARLAISRHLRRLTNSADEIQNGNFDPAIASRLSIKRNDEIGVLNQSTMNEIGFLNTFSKFTNKNVAKAIARNEIDFSPHLKDITIFFSDIRGFTAISDGFKQKFQENSPKEIIGFLNDYMGRMVECVTLSNGNIDKFEGDAVMAVWGILRDESLDFELLPDSDPRKKELEEKHKQHVREDAINAVRGTIAMRYALMKYNKDAEAFTKAHENEPLATYKPHIRIGCGLNTGRATCGIMGGQDKMEYTSIGDAVNFASRTESSNKPCGTDILITEDTYQLLRNEYIRTEDNNFTIPQENLANEIVVERIPVEFEVKGKGAQHFYGVVNMPGFSIEEFFRQGNKDFTADPDCVKAVGPTGPKTLNEVRNMLGIPIPDFEKVNLNEEENKIQVKQ